MRLYLNITFGLTNRPERHSTWGMPHQGNVFRLAIDILQFGSTNMAAGTQKPPDLFKVPLQSGYTADPSILNVATSALQLLSLHIYNSHEPVYSRTRHGPLAGDDGGCTAYIGRIIITYFYSYIHDHIVAKLYSYLTHHLLEGNSFPFIIQFCDHSC